ncbi:hypothetical protein [Paraburkholderia domus]|jgi:hypothetical protein|uniref:Uncharacterized protein n=1 Tax=Paraburkholderia domus TaxID=2793075 RepID=A0A9N8N1Y0_9BURK|nr:hypothetical protein [Paraburkholderia domus]MBK5049969.1 hypothetical protein [Burkholderia sp. R-70006]MBK5063005.1 hypothetical protein [Burkholderia sp. R-70199]MBK5121427.1 hypothetical protein [Burkholderia sp. R-69980]MBK5166570.1 hypothetical protein [Burkholderia sp. R-70211]MBK5182445.1 hypothetical protein [Burkholderia sp. R-69749]MCI0147288.1 hypothetical protein [Paraburkholderia sediminicola]
MNALDIEPESHAMCSTNTMRGDVRFIVSAVMLALKMQLRRCRGETLSLVSALVAIAIGSLAFWLTQPAHLFNGGAAPPASATVTPLNRNNVLFTHGLLSLELLSTMRHTSPELMPDRGTGANKFCAPHGPAAALLTSCEIHAHRACIQRAIAH